MWTRGPKSLDTSRFCASWWREAFKAHWADRAQDLNLVQDPLKPPGRNPCVFEYVQVFCPFSPCPKRWFNVSSPECHGIQFPTRVCFRLRGPERPTSTVVVVIHNKFSAYHSLSYDFVSCSKVICCKRSVDLARKLA